MSRTALSQSRARTAREEVVDVEAARGRAGRESLVDRLRRWPVDPWASHGLSRRTSARPQGAEHAPGARAGQRNLSSVADASAQRILVVRGPPGSPWPRW